jgi:hypothetical protein
MDARVPSFAGSSVANAEAWWRAFAAARGHRVIDEPDVLAVDGVTYANRPTSCHTSTTAPTSLRKGLMPLTSSSRAQTTSAPRLIHVKVALRSNPSTPVDMTTTAVSHTASAGFGH